MKWVGKVCRCLALKCVVLFLIPVVTEHDHYVMDLEAKYQQQVGIHVTILSHSPTSCSIVEVLMLIIANVCKAVSNKIVINSSASSFLQQHIGHIDASVCYMFNICTF